MAIIREFGRHVRALGQKLTSENIHNFGQKALHGAHVIGRKMSNTLHKAESIASAALPIASKIATMAGYISRARCTHICWKWYKTISPSMTEY